MNEPKTCCVCGKETTQYLRLPEGPVFCVDNRGQFILELGTIFCNDVCFKHKFDEEYQAMLNYKKE